MKNYGNNVVHVDGDVLKEWVTNAFQTNGLNKDHASIVAVTLVEANLRGVDTHGVILVETYVNRLQAKSLNPTPKLCIKSSSMVTSCVDGENGLGQVAAYTAMDYVISNAKKNGLAMATVNNSNHFGAAAFYSMMATEQNCIGIAMSNASPRLAPWGGVTPTYGNNPWSIAVPYEGFPVVLDLANSVVAFSKILTARETGEMIPSDWALTKNGERTTDPYVAELLLPFGGYKGYGIAFMVEALTSILGGAAVGKEVGNYNSLEEGQNVGHTFICIHIPTLTDEVEFQERLQTFIDQLHTSEKLVENQEIFLPGEKEYHIKEKRMEEGVPLSKELYGYLQQFKSMR